jgi:hypothetical protein
MFNPGTKHLEGVLKATNNGLDSAFYLWRDLATPRCIVAPESPIREPRYAFELKLS